MAIGVSDVDNIVALGVDIWGKKQVLGVRQGATENTIVCTELLEDLVERGLQADGITCSLSMVAKLCRKQSRKSSDLILSFNAARCTSAEMYLISCRKSTKPESINGSLPPTE